MKKSELIDKLIEEFVKEKDLIKRNLVEALDVVSLSCKNGCSKVTITIKWEVENE